MTRILYGICSAANITKLELHEIAAIETDLGSTDTLFQYCIPFYASPPQASLDIHKSIH